MRGPGRVPAQAGLGIEQELSGGDYLLTFLQALDNFRLVSPFLSKTDLNRSITTLAFD